LLAGLVAIGGRPAATRAGSVALDRH
jgi:hypothetical protein